MPTAFEHLRKSNENRSAIEHLALGVPINPPPNAWLVTMYFYTALHLVEKKLAVKGLHSRRHAKRFEHIAGHLSEIDSVYLAMYNDSMKARYGCDPIEDDLVREAKENLETICSELGETLVIPEVVVIPTSDIDLSDAK